MRENILRDESYSFALKVITICRNLTKQKEYILSKQLIRSGTAIGALVRESEYAQSRADFVNKLSVALKEANETEYWLLLLKDSNYITQGIHDEVSPEIDKLISILVSSIKTAKGKMKKTKE